MTPDHDVIVVGAGPAGLLLAAELTRQGIDVVLLERRSEPGERSRAIGVHAPVLAALEESGATDRILARAVRIPRGIARSRGRVLGEVRFDRLQTRFPFVATVPQGVTEAAVADGGPTPQRGVHVVGVNDLGDRVNVITRTTADAGELTARVVVVASGADGRHLAPASLGLRVHTYRDRYLMADIADAPSQPADTAIATLDPAGVLESFPLPAGGRRLVAWDRMLSRGDARGGYNDVDDAERLRRAVAERTGDDALAAAIERSSAFGIRRVLAQRMRVGRVFVIGDAAHEVSPIGGQGMNLGLLDAVTLAPLLARWLRTAGIDSAHSGEAARALARWEGSRLASARTAARFAGVNTALGRPRSPATHGVAMVMLGAALSGPFALVPARVYAMGLDRAARGSGGEPAGHDELRREQQGSEHDESKG